MVLRAIRDKDVYLKLHARLELTVANIKMSTPNIMKQAEDLKRQLEAVKVDERYYKKETSILQEKIDALMLDFLKQDKLEKADSENLRMIIEENRDAAKELEVDSANCAQLSRTVDQIKVENELKDRELIRAKNKLRSLKNDWAIEDLAIQDASKRLAEAQAKLKEFQLLYEQVKNERNKYVYKSQLKIVKSNSIVISKIR